MQKGGLRKAGHVRSVIRVAAQEEVVRAADAPMVEERIEQVLDGLNLERPCPTHRRGVQGRAP
eukprot:10443637-Alexandrium_andersonii.AAC.1